MTSGVTYNWTNTNPAIGLASPGSGNIAAFTATNSTAAPITGNIEVIPTAYDNCTGTAINFTITVNPRPTVNTVTNRTVCVGTEIAAIEFTSPTTGATFAWRRNDVAIGLTPTTGTVSTPAFTAANSTTGQITGIIYATATANGCSGIEQTVTAITVNPMPTVAAIDNLTVCSGTTGVSIALSGNETGGGYSWANDNTTIGLVASGTGTAVGPFTATNSGTAPITAEITVTPRFTTGAVCTGETKTFEITVDPKPTVENPGNQTLCAGTSTSAIAFTGNIATGVTYHWVMSHDIGAGLSGTGDIDPFETTITGTEAVVATVTVTPKYGTLECAGDPVNFTITVNPTTVVSFLPYDAEECAPLKDKVYWVTPGVGPYNWSVSGPGFSGGVSNSLDNFFTIEEMNNPGTLTLTVTFGSTGCLSASSLTTTINVITGGTPTFNTYTPNVCFDDEITYTILPAVRYEFAVTNGEIIASTDNTVTVHWNELGATAGRIDATVFNTAAVCLTSFTAQVNVTIAICKFIDCGGSPKEAIEDDCFLGHHLVTATDDWNIKALYGTTLTSTKYIIGTPPTTIERPNTLVGYQFPVGTTHVKAVAFSGAVAAISDTCEFDVIVTSLGAKATLTSSLNLGTICSNGEVNYMPTSATTTATFEWLRRDVAGIMPPPATDRSDEFPINETLINTTSSAITVTYEIYLTDGICENMQEVRVIVNPDPSVVINEPDPICEGEPVEFHALAYNVDPIKLTWQWYLNGDPIFGAESALYIYTPANDDLVHIEISTENECGYPVTVASNKATMKVISPTHVPTLKDGGIIYTYIGLPVNLMDAVYEITGLTYNFYENPDKTGKLTPPTVVFDPSKAEFYYVTEDNGVCESEVNIIRLLDSCPPETEDFEGNSYNVVSLAGLCWTANLKSLLDCEGNEIEFARSYTCTGCPDDLADTYGLLYDWYSAVGTDVEECICPEGYRLPTREEWRRLEQFSSAQLRSGDFWLDPPGYGSDDFGFDARPAGWYNGAIDRFESLYGFAGWWAADDIPGTETSHYFSILYYCGTIQEDIKSKSDGFSVRCVWIAK
jgi:uncharacterized protein (TIGR02145 family)